MIRGPGLFERPLIVGAPTFSYGNMYLVAHHSTCQSKTAVAEFVMFYNII